MLVEKSVVVGPLGVGPQDGDVLVSVWRSIGLMDDCRHPRRRRCSRLAIESREYSYISKEEADIGVDEDIIEDIYHKNDSRARYISAKPDYDVILIWRNASRLGTPHCHFLEIYGHYPLHPSSPATATPYILHILHIPFPSNNNGGRKEKEDSQAAS